MGKEGLVGKVVQLVMPTLPLVVSSFSTFTKRFLLPVIVRVLLGPETNIR